MVQPPGLLASMEGFPLCREAVVPLTGKAFLQADLEDELRERQLTADGAADAATKAVAHE